MTHSLGEEARRGPIGLPTLAPDDEFLRQRLPLQR